MEKLKLPELKVASFVTSLDDSQLNDLKGGVAPPDSAQNCTWPVFGCEDTSTYCSSSDINQGITCSPAVGC
jgi:natural product precursor